MSDPVRLLTSHLDDVLWIATADQSRMIYVSPSYERVIGQPIEAVLARSSAFFDAIHPDDRAQVMDRRRAVGPWQHEYRVLRPDGSIRWIWGRGQPISDNGESYLIGVATDITDRKLAELDRQIAVERLELITRSIHDGLWDWNLVDNTAWWSDSFRENYGIAPDVVPSYETWAARIHPEDRPRVLASFANALDSGARSWSDEYRMIRADNGAVRDSFDRAFVVYDDGKPVRMGGIVMDITGRRQLENQLRHAQRLDAMGQLAGGIAHDFNNMLQAIMIDLQLMRSADHSSRVDDLVDHAFKAVERAASLTKQLLMFTRREAMELRMVPFDPAVSSIARMLERLLGEQIEIEIHLGAPDLRISVDGGMLDQVVMNLALNARDAMPSGGRLTIATSVSSVASRPGNYACLLVRDTGAGIPQDILPQIFEPFFSTKERGHGTGLGLAVVYGIVEQHRGWIEVDSAPDRGTTFRAYFPIGQPIAEIDADPTTATTARGSETILVVEDDGPVRRAIRRLLEGEGYRVWDAPHAASALEIWDREAGKIDLVFTDLVMPGGMDGTELARELERRRPGLKLVFATGYRRNIELEVHQTLLQKPVTAATLLDAVRTSLDR